MVPGRDIKEEIKELEEKFEDLKFCTLSSLIKRESENEDFLKNFKHRLTMLSGSIRERHRRLFSRRNRALIRRAESVGDVFDVISGYMNFLNCSLLFYIIDRFIDSGNVKQLEYSFRSLLKAFRLRTSVSELQGVWKSHLPSDYVEVLAQCSHQGTMTLEEVEETKEALACQASLEPYTFFIIKTSPGSIVITWAIPKHIAPVFAKSMQDQTFLKKHNIETMKIDKYNLDLYVELCESEDKEEVYINYIHKSTWSII